MKFYRRVTDIVHTKISCGDSNADLWIQEQRNRKRDGHVRLPAMQGTACVQTQTSCTVFHSFFIPLFPLGKVGEYLECQTCKKTFSPDWFHTGALLNETASHSQSTTPLSSAQKGSCLTWSLLLAGGGAFLFAGVFTLLLTLAQIDKPTNWEGFWGLLILCPAPFSLLGIILFGLGIRNRSKVEKDSQGEI